jgi:hypothetical protein
MLFGPRASKPVFAEDVNAERAMRIAELKWLLREIAERSEREQSYSDNDNWESIGRGYEQVA